ncbi:MAG: aminotransferase class V-fold PLP-dependent enzyme, partial [Flammeovirgaceae bacterium]|nr:aminotransferase class V-fold PLP-dependent enzyme [Flammeovirgaceae bacterium]
MQLSHRRKFVKQLLATSLTGLVLPSFAETSELAPPTSAEDEKYWDEVKKQVTVPADHIMMNAANLCPSPAVVQDKVQELTKALNKDVSFQYRALFSATRKKSVSLLAQFVGADENEVGITRNTSESNCMIVHGLDLKPGDEIIIWEQNHPSNEEVWMSQAKRIGFTIKKISVPAAPTSVNDLIQPFVNAITPNTKLIAFSHLSNVSGLALPAKEICQVAKARGIMTLVDGAQTFGSMNINVHDMDCTFYSASTHKWLMGPFENGVLYVQKDYFSRIWPAIIGGGWKESTTVDQHLCVLGQRNEPSPAALPEIVAFHEAIGIKNIESRIVQLSTHLKQQIKTKIPKATFVTPESPLYSGGIVIFNLPGKEIHEITDKLYHTYKIATAPSGGIRLSPHIYNTMKDLD